MQINFMRPRKIASALSILLVLISVISLTFKGLNAGLDFTGGTLIEIKLSQPVNLEEIRDVLGSKVEDDFQVSYFGSEEDILIKIPGGSENNLSDEIVSTLANVFQFDLRRKDFIGPQIGEELRDQGGLGLLAALLVMMVYIMFRFQFKFALGALLALVHDVLIVLGFFSIFYIGFNLTVLAAVLAVIGYSLNDTIVDANLTTLIVALILYTIGTGPVQGFAITLSVGILTSMFTAILVTRFLVWLVYRNRKHLETLWI